jgi:deoxyadenosine/deoxycytidine kinase
MGKRIAIEGLIGAGKSSVMEALATHFPDIPTFQEPLDEWGELLDLFYADPNKWALAFSLKVLLGFQHPLQCTHDICIVERSPLSNRYVFTQMLFNDNIISRTQFDVYKDVYEALGWMPDAIVYIEAPPEVCLERVQKRGRQCEIQKNAVDITYLKRLAFMYDSNMLKFYKNKIIRVDGSQPLEKVVEDAIQAVAQCLRM